MANGRRRVVVTGMGMVTPVGSDVESSWTAIREGRGGVGPITLFDASTFATRIAAEVKGFSLDDYRTDAQRWRDHCRTTQFALAAATMAMEHAGLADAGAVDPRRFGVYLGSGEGQQDFPSFVDLVHRSTRGGEVDKALFTGPRARIIAPDPRGRARAGYARRNSGRRLRRSRAQRHLPDGLRGQRPGDRRGCRGDPPRCGRRDLDGGHAQHDPPVRPDRLHPPDGDVDAE